MWLYIIGIISLIILIPMGWQVAPVLAEYFAPPPRTPEKPSAIAREVVRYSHSDRRDSIF
jgi:hypothetical protein